MFMNLITIFAQGAGNGCGQGTFFGLKPWYAYLKTNGDCTIRDFKVLGGTAGSDFVLIALALVDNLLRIAGLVAIGYIIYGGVLYITSQGSPDQTGKAQNTILNALIGLVVAVVATAFVSFIGNRVG
jgi:hypothetical protein